MQVSLAFDACYSYLLLTIQTLWHLDEGDYRDSVVKQNFFPLMQGILAPIANFMVKHQVGQNGRAAAPCFQYYDFTDEVMPLGKVYKQVQRAAELFPDAQGLKDALAGIGGCISLPLKP